MRILLVEDHQDTLDVMRRILVAHGHDVTTAMTLGDAVRLCRESRFDLAVCDIGLPDGDGWELANVARECGCPAIALTGYGMADEIKKARSAGFAEHILKPVVFDKLLAAIERVHENFNRDHALEDLPPLGNSPDG